MAEGFGESILGYAEGRTPLERKGDMNGNITCSTISVDGRYWAASSEEGTIIKIFEFESRKEIACLERGRKPAVIISLAFSQDNSFLAISSDHGTIHVYSTGLGVCCSYKWEMSFMGTKYYGYCKIGSAPPNSQIYFIPAGKEFVLAAIDENGGYTTYKIKVDGKGGISAVNCGERKLF